MLPALCRHIASLHLPIQKALASAFYFRKTKLYFYRKNDLAKTSIDHARYRPLRPFGRPWQCNGGRIELGVTVGAISQQLRKAEAEVGLRLVERKGKSIALTRAALQS